MKKQRIVTALEFDNSRICMLQAQQQKAGLRLVSVDEVPVESPGSLVNEIKDLAEKYKIKKTRLITALPRHQVFIRKVTVPPGSYEEIRSMLGFEAEKHLPFASENAAIDFYPVNELSDSQQNEIFLIAAKKETVSKHIDILNSAGLYPEQVNVVSFTFASIIAQIQDKESQSSTVILKLDKQSWEIEIFLGSKLFLSRGLMFPQGKSNTELSEMVQREIKNSLSMLYSAHKGEKISAIHYISTDEDQELIKLLQDNLGISLVEFNVYDKLKNFGIGRNVAGYLTNRCIVPVGLFMPLQYRINLIPLDILRSYLHRSRRKMQLITLGSMLAILIIAAGVFFSTKYRELTHKRDIMKNIERMKPRILKLAKLKQKISIVDDFKKNNLIALKVLKELSTNLPRNVYIRQFQYDLEQELVVIRGRTDSYAVASKVTSLFGKSSYFSQVVNKGAHTVNIGDKKLVNFEVNCTLNSSKTQDNK